MIGEEQCELARITGLIMALSLKRWILQSLQEHPDEKPHHHKNKRLSATFVVKYLKLTPDILMGNFTGVINALEGNVE